MSPVTHHAERSALEFVRSFLFVPGDSERKLRRAFRSGAGAVIVDLEDSVHVMRKGTAREVVASTLPDVRGGSLSVLRVNEWDVYDLELARSLGFDGVVIPKATAASVGALPDWVPPIVALIESAEGVLTAPEIAKSRGVVAMMLGTVDLGVDLRLNDGSDRDGLRYSRSAVVLASAAARLRAPIDGVHTQLNDAQGLDEEIRHARALGFGGKACIHPAQVRQVEMGFRTSDLERSWARNVLAALEGANVSDCGVTTYAGEIVDVAVVRRARSILEQGARE